MLGLICLFSVTIASFLVAAASNSPIIGTALLSSKVAEYAENSQTGVNSDLISNFASFSDLSETPNYYSEASQVTASSEEAVSSKPAVSSGSKAALSSKPVSTPLASSKSPSSVKPAASSKPIISSKPAVSSSPIVSGTLPAENFTVNSNYGVVTLSRHDLLCENVAWELGTGFSNETTKAMAVVCYTYIKYGTATGKPNVLLLSQTDAKAKWGSKFTAGWNKIDAAVTAVEGLYVTKDNKNPIAAFFCTSSAGKTETATNVWGGSKDTFGNALSYLTTVNSSWDGDLAANYIVKATFPSDTVKKLAGDTLGISLTGDPSGWFKNITLDSAGYVGHIQVGDTVCTGRDVREKMLSLRSAAFTVSYADGVFTFTTTGYGHGVGLSIYGAEYLATAKGFSYSSILAYYYTGTALKKIA